MENKPHEANGDDVSCPVSEIEQKNNPRLSQNTKQAEINSGHIEIVDGTIEYLEPIMGIYNALSINRELDTRISRTSENSYSKKGGILKVPDIGLIRESLESRKHFFRVALAEGQVKGFLWGCYDFSPLEPFYSSFMRDGKTTEAFSIYEDFQKQGLVAYGMDLMIDPGSQRSSLGFTLYHEYVEELKKQGIKKIIFMAEKLRSIEIKGSVISLDMDNEATLRMHDLLGAVLIKTVGDEVRLEKNKIARRTCEYYMLDVEFASNAIKEKLALSRGASVEKIRNRVLRILRDNLLLKTASRDAEDFRIRGIWDFNMRVQPRPGERVFSEPGYLVATSGLGTSFRSRNSSQSTNEFDNLIGKDGRNVLVEDKALQVAILDACYAVLSKKSSEEFILLGDTISKASQRAVIVSNEVKRVAEKYSINNARVLMIGVVNTIVDELNESGFSTTLSDLDQVLIDESKSNKLPVQHGDKNEMLIPECDILLVTGMALATSTLDGVIESAIKNKKPIVVFAQTGSNFADEYLKLGVESVIAEHYPWYCIPGRSDISVYRAENPELSRTADSQSKIEHILDRVGTPTYIYDAQQIRENAMRLSEAFDGYAKYYSVKANPNPEICSILAKLQYEAEVVTEGEMQIAIESGFRPSEMLFSGPGKTRPQIKRAISKGVSHFTAESINQLKLIDSVAREEKIEVKVLLRINLPELQNKKCESMMGGESQFGLDVNSLLTETAGLSSLTHAKIVGTQFYAASQILEPERLSKSALNQLEVTKMLMRAIPMDLEILDIGGGFGIPYKDGESALNLEECAALVRRALSGMEGAMPKIIIESGRFLVGNAGTFFTKVIDVKESFGKFHVICDGGMVGFSRPALVRSPHRIELFKTFSPNNRIETCVISGSSCSSLDTFDTVKIQLPEIGDIIAIRDAGAYGWSMSIKDFHCAEPPKEFIINK